MVLKECPMKIILGELYHLIELGWIVVAYSTWEVVKAIMTSNQAQFNQYFTYLVLVAVVLVINRLLLRRYRLQ